MFKIGEFSKLTQVSIRMLRYYDENGLLIPEFIDKMTGYRMYSSNQIEQLNRILFLKNLGFQVKEIKKMIFSWNQESMKKELEIQKREIELNIQTEKEKLMRICGYIEDLERQNIELNTQILIKSIPSYQVVTLRKIMPNYYNEGLLWKELCECTSGIEANVCFSIYYDTDYREKDVDIEVCIVIDEKYQVHNDKIVVRQTKDVKKAACFMINGPYENISIAYKEFAQWMEHHPEYKMTGENRQICHIGACNTNNPQEYVTELQIPIECES